MDISVLARLGLVWFLVGRLALVTRVCFPLPVMNYAHFIFLPLRLREKIEQSHGDCLEGTLGYTCVTPYSSPPHPTSSDGVHGGGVSSSAYVGTESTLSNRGGQGEGLEKTGRGRTERTEFISACRVCMSVKVVEGRRGSVCQDRDTLRHAPRRLRPQQESRG